VVGQAGSDRPERPFKHTRNVEKTSTEAPERDDGPLAAAEFGPELHAAAATSSHRAVARTSHPHLVDVSFTQIGTPA